VTTASYTYNAADEISGTGFTYDANGNLTAKPGQTYSYNSLNQTSSITTGSTPLSMAYADIGQTERTTAGSTAFLTGLLGLSRQSGGTTLAFTKTPGGSLVSMRSGTNHFYYVLDALGSVIALTDSTGAIAASYTYDPYGNTVTASGAQATVNPFRFASGYFDSATGLTKFGDRYYDSSLARWTQRDSISGSIADPGNLNRYVYAGDSPTNLVDVSGKNASTNPAACLTAIYGAAFMSLLFVGLEAGAIVAEGGSITIFGLSFGLGAPLGAVGTVAAFFLATTGLAGEGAALYVFLDACFWS
jgi:RHS repeat-associated protein